MFCQYAQAIKQASIKQLLALTLTDYWEQTECAVQSERRRFSVRSRRMNSYAFSRIPVARWSAGCFTFDDDCVICISHEGKLIASVSLMCVANTLFTVGAWENLFLEKKLAQLHYFAKGTLRIVATLKLKCNVRSVWLGCRRHLGKAGNVKKKKKKRKCKTKKIKAKQKKAKLTWVWH